MGGGGMAGLADVEECRSCSVLFGVEKVGTGRKELVWGMRNECWGD